MTKNEPSYFPEPELQHEPQMRFGMHGWLVVCGCGWAVTGLTKADAQYFLEDHPRNFA